MCRRRLVHGYLAFGAFLVLLVAADTVVGRLDLRRWAVADASAE